MHRQQPQQSPNSVRNQLNEVSTLLSKAAPPAAAPAIPPAPAAAPAPATLPSQTPNKEARKAVEDSLRMLPKLPETEGARASLQAQLEAIKGPMTPGARLDAAKAALERANTRRELAQQALALAQQTFEDAEAEHAQIQANIDTMRLEMAAGLGPPAQPVPDTATPALQLLQHAAAKVMEELAGTAGVDPAHVQVAQQLTTQLLEGCHITMTTAAAAADAAMPQQERRHSTKSPPVVQSSASDLEPVRTRLNGKQLPKKTLQDMWPHAATKVLKSAVGKAGNRKSVLL